MHQEVSCPWLVVAVGIETEHYDHILDHFPDIVNCCIDVRRAFNKKKNENTDGTGFDEFVRTRITSKDTWTTVWEVAKVILQKFSLLVVLCSHGKHRSLSLAIELANYTGCECVSTRSISSPLRLRPIACVMADLCDSACSDIRTSFPYLRGLQVPRVVVGPYEETATKQRVEKHGSYNTSQKRRLDPCS